ncbi:MAG: hypothetical protein IJ046_00425 [Clostridia bacterium]|nr:hypothetical protein [Clostridia bacterium]
MNIKLLSLILAVLLVFSLASCTVKDDAEGGEETTDKAEETTGEISGGIELDSDLVDTDEKNDPSDTKKPVDSEGTKDTASKDTTDKKGENNEKDPEETTKSDGKKEPVDTKKPAKDETEKAPADTTVKTEETKPAPNPADVTYEEYHAMKADDQQAFFESFGSIEDFFDWYKAAKAKYEKDNPDQEIGDGPIDLGDLIG